MTCPGAARSGAPQTRDLHKARSLGRSRLSGASLRAAPRLGYGELIFTHRDVRRVRVFHADDVVTGIDVVDLAGHAAREIGDEIDCGVADLFDGYAAAQRRVVFVPFQDIAEVADPGRGQSLDRP